MAAQTTAPAKAPSPLIERLRAGGIVAPRMAVREARRAGLRLELACALLEKESAGGRNVYGHDPSIFSGRGKVTRSNYAQYKRQRLASRNRSMQGVGPCQLTWWEFQDSADAAGGCWRPEINMRTGFSHLAALVKRYGESDGARRYNGSGAAAEAYSRDLMVKARKWDAIIGKQRAAPARRPTAPRPKVARTPEPRPQPRAQSNGASPTRPAAPRLSGLVREVHQRDDEADRAWRRLVAYGHRRRRSLHAEKAAVEARKGDSDAEDTKALLAALARIEGRLGQLVDVTVHKPEIVVGTPAPVAAAAGATAAAAAVTEGPAPTAPATKRPPEKYSVPELLREVEALETRKRQLRDELIERYEHADKQLAQVRDEPRHAEPARPKRRRKRTSDPLGGRSVVTTLGDSGVFVRRSKIALSRYLAKKGTPEHAALRKRLRREAATPRTGNVASPAWGRAVAEAQRVAGRPATGELDGELTQILLPYWPRDHIAKRVVRTTPAWRALPGQLTPNFNAKELACKDRAHTSYVSGLMREQGLSKKEARARAKGLAKRLERVRKLGGDRPIVVTSAFRTKAYNASLGGSATNSAHTRGFAVDTPPPRGVSLEQHKQHVLQAFECGVGYYPMGRGYFIHGDFDRTLGGRRTW